MRRFALVQTRTPPFCGPFFVCPFHTVLPSEADCFQTVAVRITCRVARPACLASGARPRARCNCSLLIQRQGGESQTQQGLISRATYKFKCVKQTACGERGGSTAKKATDALKQGGHSMMASQSNLTQTFKPDTGGKGDNATTKR